MEKETIKRVIEDIEFYANGMKWINGGSVKVVNVRILKREKKVIADVILYYYDKTERYNNCEYPFEVIEKFIQYYKRGC